MYLLGLGMTSKNFSVERVNKLSTLVTHDPAGCSAIANVHASGRNGVRLHNHPAWQRVPSPWVGSPGSRGYRVHLKGNSARQGLGGPSSALRTAERKSCFITGLLR